MGPRGGKYYINSNGNKTYVSRDTPVGVEEDSTLLVLGILISIIIIACLVFYVIFKITNYPFSWKIKEEKIRNRANEMMDDYVKNDWKYIPRKRDKRHTAETNKKHKIEAEKLLREQKMPHYLSLAKKEFEENIVKKESNKK